jgi:hypothetical protein
MSKTTQVIGKLAEDNPELEIIQGASHYKVKLKGMLLCILPLKLAKEGLAHNTRTRLRRAGLKV